jgi:2'-5' RNA ligase
VSRLFVSLRPPAGVLDSVAEALQPIAADPPAGLRLVPRGQWHVTLRFVGEAEPSELRSLLAAADLPRCTAELEGSPSMLSRVVVFALSGVDALAEAVCRATETVGDPPGFPRFRGHLTVARLGRRVSPGATRGRLGGLRIDAPGGNLRWNADEVELVSSATHSSGAVHEVLETFRLS